MPTILGLAGVAWSGAVQGPRSRERAQKRPLLDRPIQARAPAESLGRESLYGELTFGWSDLRVVRVGDWKYIKGGPPELFDLESDPGETANRRARRGRARERGFEDKLAGVIADEAPT